VVDPTLSTFDISISDNSDSSFGNTSAFECDCYEVKDDTPQFNYHGPKIKILEQESPMTICTADTIGTIRSQRLFQALFDSGSNVSMIKRSALQKGIVTKLVIPNLWGPLQDILRCKKLSQCKTSDCQSSIRTGTSTKKSTSVGQWQRQVWHYPGYKLSFQDWNKVELLRRKHGMVWLFHPTLSTWRFGFKRIDAMEDMFHIQVEDEIFNKDWLEYFATEILDANQVW
jgi:hypothetical protein